MFINHFLLLESDRRITGSPLVKAASTVAPDASTMRSPYYTYHSGAPPPRPASLAQIPQLMAATPSSTTVVLQENRASDGGHAFANGMMTGALLGTASSWGWGHHHHFGGLGAGLGWGCGWGWGGYDRGFHYSDTDIHIHNHYDNDNNVVINEIPRSTSNEQDGYADPTTAMQSAYHHSEFLGSEHVEDDFGGDYDINCDGYDAGGFDFIF